MTECIGLHDGTRELIGTGVQGIGSLHCCRSCSAWIVLTGLVLTAPKSLGQETEAIVSGVLEELDLSNMKGKIKTDLGNPVFFEVTKPELFKGLTVGERITIQVDDQGRATKVIDMPVPRLGKSLQKRIIEAQRNKE